MCVCVCVFLGFVSVSVSVIRPTSAIYCLKKLASEITLCLSSGTLNSTHPRITFFLSCYEVLFVLHAIRGGRKSRIFRRGTSIFL